jgi:amino-acid N-acetyltransferase
MEEARQFGLKRLFVLTYRNVFFSRFGFEEVEKRDLPQKIWTDCVKCPKFPQCDEFAMVLRLS